MNEVIILLVIAILPVYLIGLYIYKKDKDKESKKLLSKLFIYGIFSCIPAVIIEILLGLPFGENMESMDLITLAVYIFITIALVEEICKWYVTYKVAFYHKEFDHIYDAIVYCVFVSMGFAVFENILYVLTSGVMAGLLRAISAVPGHACFAVIMGNYLGLAKAAKIEKKDKEFKRNLLLSIIMPSIVHGIYDFCLSTGNLISVFSFLILIIFIYIYSIKKIKKLANIKNNLIDNILLIKYCPTCMKSTIGNYCRKCGAKLIDK